MYFSNALTTNSGVGDNPVCKIDAPRNVTFKATDTKLFVPVVTLSNQNDNKLLEWLKTIF